MSILVVSWDRVGARMAGSAARAFEMAAALARSGEDVVLGAPEGSDAPREVHGLRLVRVPSESSITALVDACDAVVLPGRMELVSAPRKPCVVDLYDPFLLSNLDLHGADFTRSGGRPLLALRWLEHHLRHGDFFLCASEAQRAFWLGMLASAGRVNRANYERDPELRSLIDIVPFGVPDEPPVPGAPVMRGVLPGIGEHDRVVLWAGGLWNWVDPLTLVRAAALLRDRRPEVRTVFLGTRHPNPEIGQMAIAREAIALAGELGLDGRVSFVDWVPYEERQRWLLECDVGVSLHRRGVESEFAFRTRTLDYVWALRPMVVTTGDDLASRVEREHLGRVVPPDDPGAVAAAIEAVLDDPEAAARTARLETARRGFSWQRAVEPLRRFARAPRRANDREGGAWVAPDARREEMPDVESALVSEDFVAGPRSVSPRLGGDVAPVRRFRASFDRLCRVDALPWVEPPVDGANLVMELREAGSRGAPAARVIVPAPVLPRDGWQRFEFRPIEHSAGREWEVRFSLAATPVVAEDHLRPTSPFAPGRVCLWLCGASPEAPAGEPVLVARYLLAGVASELPVPEESFLFLHNTTVPVAGAVDASFPLVALESGDGPQVVADVERLRVELAQVAVQAAGGRQALLEFDERLEEFDERLEARVEKMVAERLDAHVDEKVVESVVRGAREEIERNYEWRIRGQATDTAREAAREEIERNYEWRIRGQATDTAREAARETSRAEIDALRGEIDARVAAAVDEARSAAWSARAGMREEIAGTSIVGLLARRAVRTARRVVRAGSWLATRAFVALLSLLSVPLGLLAWFAITATDLFARLRGADRTPRGLAGAPRTSAIPADAPVSIVIPTWNGASLLEMSLPPLFEALRVHGHPDDEIIVVDNGSEDETTQVLERFAGPQLRPIRLDRNHGFAGATNRGTADARNPVVILLNNDMVVEPDFVQPLLDAFVEEPGAFGISCQIDFLDPKKERWETGKVHARFEQGSVRLFHLDRFDADLLYPVFFAGGGASAYDRAKFMELGGFDEAVFSPVYIEDVDLGYRAWKRGWPSLMAPRSFVHHKHRGTTRRIWSEGRIHSFFVKNLAALLWKNVDSRRILARHLAGLAVTPWRCLHDQGGRAALLTFVGLLRQIPPTMRARLAEARVPRALSDEEIFALSRHRHAYRARYHADDARVAPEKPQVLLVSPYSPVPAVHGGATRIANLLREMRDACDVTLVTYWDTEPEAAPESVAELRTLCREAILVKRDMGGTGPGLLPRATVGFWSQAMFDEVEFQLDRRRFDVVQVEYTHMAHYLPPPCEGLLRVLVEHDVASVVARRVREAQPTALRRWRKWRDELRMLEYETNHVEDADLVVAMSEVDRDALGRAVDPSHVVVVPNGVSCRDFPVRTEPAEPATILFVGFFRHDPNVEAVEWFAREVLPRVRDAVPEAVFRVVGAYPPDGLRTLAATTPGFELTGRVPSTAPHYRRATVFVAPILQGSGTRLKILEAMASGSPVVSTTIGAEGLGAGPGEIRIADDPAAFAEAIVALLRDPAERDAIARRARAFVEERFDWPAIARRMLEAWAGAGVPFPAHVPGAVGAAHEQVVGEATGIPADDRRRAGGAR
ncbi:glycosyltransferase [bacterium]|nr:glycosyltransferase [bacterium]